MQGMAIMGFMVGWLLFWGENWTDVGLWGDVYGNDGRGR